MRVKNIAKVPVVVAGLTILPRRIGTIPDADFKAWKEHSTGHQITASTMLEVVPDDEAAATAAPAEETAKSADEPPADETESPAEEAQVELEDTKPSVKGKRGKAAATG